MSISDPVDMAHAEPTSTLGREARLPPGVAVVAIVVLSAAAWAAVVLGALGLAAAFR